ncbi:MAG: hypothetical protein GY845_22290, partial [Planctomycetes bacterium]|nr:hypothetical protein [Planctomycetota bacterium]
ALDQYYSAYQSCTLRSGYLNIENQNSRYGDCASNVTSIMRGQIHPYIADAIDPYAAGQVGWRDSDDDDILDPLDTNLPINIDSISQDGNTATFSGMAEIIPYPSPHHTSVTINTLTGVQYRIDAGDWQPATATDGAFDGTYENYYATTTTTPFSSGLRILEVAALDSAGNMSNIRATETITIPDPIDGGLNTQFLSSDIGIAGQTSFVSGVTYHLEGVNVTKVEYRIDGGPWQAVVAQDGAFDSDYEPFTLALGSLEVGTYLIEAFATADGQTEVNIASREIEIRDNTSTVFLPIVIR